MKELPRTANQAEFARIIGKKPSYVSELKQTGRLVIEGGKILVKESLALIEATRDPSKAGTVARHAANRAAVLAIEGGEVSDPNEHEKIDSAASDAVAGFRGYDYQASKAKREHWAAEREHALWRKEAGELMERGAVVAAFSDAGAMIRSKLEAWSETLPGQLAGQTEAQVQLTIADQVDRLLRDLSDSFGRHVGGRHG